MEIIDKSGGKYTIMLYRDGNLVSRRVSDDVVVGAMGTTEPRTPPPAPVPVPVPQPPLPPLKGLLRYDGKAFTDDTGPRVPVFCHAGDLALCYVEGQNTLVHQALRDMQAAGYSGVRTWTSINWVQTNPFWGNRKLNPSDSQTRQQLEELFRVGSEDYGLQWHIALGDVRNVSRTLRDEYWHWLADLVNLHPTWFALIEGLNEAYGKLDDPKEIERMVQICRDVNPDHLYALSAAAGASSERRTELHKWTPSWMQHTYHHAYRGGHWWDQTRHAFGVGYEQPVRRNGWSGEPPGINWDNYNWVSVMDRPKEWTASRYALYLAQTAMCRQMPTYFCSHGVKIEGRFTDAPGFVETPKLIAKLPKDVMAFDQLFHGGTTWSRSRVLAAVDECRIDHAESNDGRMVMTIYGPDGLYNLPIKRRWRGLIYNSSGDVVERTLEPGDHYSVRMTSGQLLVGRLL